MLQNSTFLNFGSKESKTLNRDFNHLITSMLHTMNESDLFRTETYDLILNEWFAEEKTHYFDEFRYRITDGENINQVLLEIITNDEMPSSICKNQCSLLQEYLIEDNFK